MPPSSCPFILETLPAEESSLRKQRFLFILGAVAVYRALQRESGPGNRRVLATFVVLIAALSLLAKGVG